MKNIIKQEDIIYQARTWLGTKYHHQGRLKRSARGAGGVDCIGLIVGVMEELQLPDGSGKQLLCSHDETGYSQYPDGEKLRASIERQLQPVRIEKIAPGNVLLFKIYNDPQHVGMVTDYPSGGLGIIHCHSRAGRMAEHVLSDVWCRLIVSAYRFKPEHLMPVSQNLAL